MLKVPISESTATMLVHVEPWLSSRSMAAPQMLILIRGAWHDGVAGKLRERRVSVSADYLRTEANGLRLARRLQRSPESLSQAVVSRPRDCDGAAAVDALR